MRLNRTYTPLIFAGTVILLYLPVFPGWAKDVFTNENNQHCIAIPFISLYIAFQKKNILMKLSAASSGQKGALWLYVLGLMVYVIGVGGGIVFFQQLSLVVLIAGTVLFLYGRDIFCALMFPLFYLVFAIPIPEAAYQAFSSPLKQCASMISAHLIRLFGIPVYREGVNLFFPYTSIEVVDACSGMRSLVSLLAVGTVFAYLFQKRIFLRILLVLSTVPIAIFSNVMRIMLTGIIAHTFGLKYAQGILHTVLGTVIVIALGAALIVLFNYLLNRLMRNTSRDAKQI